MEETKTEDDVPVKSNAGNEIQPDAFRQTGSETLENLMKGIEIPEQDIKSIAEFLEKTSGEIREMRKLYHNEFAGRLKSMQDELDRYHEMEKGRTFDSILTEIATLYSEYESIITDITDDKLQKRIRYLFEDLLQILEANGVSKQKSQPGDKRNTRHCRVLERLGTPDPALHDTVALSKSTGFYIENRTLVKERVDVYLYTDTNAGKPAENYGGA